MQTPWHHTPQAQAILARIAPADVLVLENYSLGPDGFYLAVDERTEQALTAVRHAAADKLAGCTWASTQEPFDRDAALRWMDALDAAGPSIGEVLEERFGEPNAYRGYARDVAAQLWRNAAEARTIQEIAA